MKMSPPIEPYGPLNIDDFKRLFDEAECGFDHIVHLMMVKVCAEQIEIARARDAAMVAGDTFAYECFQQRIGALNRVIEAYTTSVSEVEELFEQSAAMREKPNHTLN